MPNGQAAIAIVISKATTSNNKQQYLLHFSLIVKQFRPTFRVNFEKVTNNYDK